MAAEEYAKRMPDYNRWNDMASKAASFLQDHPGSKAQDIAEHLGTYRNRIGWMLESMVQSGAIVKVDRKYGQGFRYYLYGQDLLPEDCKNQIDAKILKAARQLVDIRNGWGMRAKDIRNKLEADGIPEQDLPTNNKIVAVITNNGYIPDPENTSRVRRYIRQRRRR